MLLTVLKVFDAGLCKEKYVKRNKDNVCMKEKLVLGNVWLEEKDEINRLKIVSIQSKECS